MKSIIQHSKMVFGLMAIGLALFLGVRTSAGINPPLCTPISITVQPASQTFCLGYNASLTVTASGSSVGYRWRKDGTNLVNGAKISGVMAQTLMFTPVTAGSAGPYDVVITNTCSSDTSSVAMVTTSLKPSILTQPADQTKCQSQTAVFSVTASGAQGYQWFKNGGTFSGARSATLILNNVTMVDSGSSYKVVVTNGYGSVTSSPPAVLTVITAGPSISRQPANQTVCAGRTANFSVTASGSALSYQWRRYGVSIPGETSATLTLCNVAMTNAGLYSVVVSNPCSYVISSNATLTVLWPPTAYWVTGGGTYCSGGSGKEVKLNYGQSGVYYELRRNGYSTGSPVAGANSALSFGLQTAAGIYTVVGTRTDTGCSGAMNGSATVTVNSAPSITSQPTSQTVCPGQTASFTAAAGGSPTPTVQWQVSANGGATFNNWVGKTSTTLSFITATGDNGKQYRAVFSDSCGSATSTVANLTVVTMPNPVAWWKFDEGNGPRATNSIGNGNNGTLRGNPLPTWVTTGILNNALSFDGISDHDQYVQVQPTTGTVTGSFTVAAWVFPLDPEATMTVFSTEDWSDTGFDFQLMNGNTIRADIGNGSYFFASADANFRYTTGTWYHIACVVTPTNYTIYANGAVVGSGTYDTAVPLLYNATHTITIGAEFDSYAYELFNGEIDDVRVYNQALAGCEVVALYNSDTVGDGIPNWWRLQYFGTPSTTNSTSCASCDPDGDGSTNLQEYNAGTDPLHSPLPTFSPDGGAYLTARPVKISYAIAVATIHYTTNGLVPTTSDPVIANGGTVTVSAPATLLRARAFKTGMTTSGTKSGLYQIGGLVVAGWSDSFALQTSGTLWSWGQNWYGQLGDGTASDRWFPAPVSLPAVAGRISPDTGVGVWAVAGGQYHTVAADTNGTVWTWGVNWYGQLGDGTSNSTNSPESITGVGNVVGVAAGVYHTMAVRSNGTVWAWGYNGYGQLGIGSYDDTNAPVQAVGLTQIIGIAAGAYHSVALRSDGTVWAWGDNDYGQLGDGSTARRSIPVQVNGLTNVVAIAAGAYHTMALCADRTVWTWGNNGNGQLGRSGDQSVPGQVSGLSNVVAIAAGQSHTLAVTANGTAYAWGYNYYGQLGLGDNYDRSSPTQVNLIDVRSVSAGDSHSLALLGSDVMSWGHNDYGQLGRCTQDDTNTPAKVYLSLNSPTPVMAIVSGDATICAGGSTNILAALTGQGPWTVTWSDGSTQSGITWSPVTNTVRPSSTTVYTVTAVSDSMCVAGISSGSATIIVDTTGLSGGTAAATPSEVTCGDSATIVLSGYTAGAAIQWQSTVDWSAWTNLVGKTSATMNTGPLTVMTYYRAVVSSPGCSAISDYTYVYVDALSGGTVTPSSWSVTCGDSATITLSDYTAGATIQWQSSPDTGTWTNIVGQTNATMNTGPLTAMTYYQAVLTRPGCSAISDYTHVSVDVLTGGTATADPSSVACGGSTTITLSDYTTGTTIQWQSSLDGGVWTNLVGQTNATMNTGPLTVTTYYQAVVSRPGCSAYSGTVTVTVVNSIQPSDDDVFTGKNTAITIRVLDNDTHSGGPLTIASVTPANDGTVTINAGSTNVTYAPNAGFVGPDTFVYTVTDGLCTNNATVSIMVGGAHLTALCRSNRIVLSWDIPDWVVPEGDFTIKRSTTQGGPYISIGTAPSADRIYVDTTVVPGTTYYYVVTFPWTDPNTSIYYASLQSNEASSSTCNPPHPPPGCPVALDAVFIIDNTGSMGGSLSTIQAGIETVLGDIIASSGNNYQLALVTPDTEQVNVRLNFSSNNVTDFETALSDLYADGGARTPESTDECLNTVVNALAASGRTNTDTDCLPTTPVQIGDFAPPFRGTNTARRLVVLITDAPPGGFCDSYTTGVDDVRAHQYALVAKSKGIKINAIPVGTAADMKTVMRDYATTTCGWYSPVTSNGSGIEEAVLNMVYMNVTCTCP